MTEAQLQDRIVELAHTLGWRAVHFGAARTEKGWRTPVRYDSEGHPDLHLIHVRGKDEVYYEVKVWARRNTLTVKQQEWLSDLTTLGRDARMVTERDWDDVIVPRLAEPTKARVA